MAPQQQKANLARIRDNQRRSRARRKDYLQELEAKFRTCEAAGAEASAEIQSAARRVLDENKRLRLLLKDRGLTDAEIDGTSPCKAQRVPPDYIAYGNPQFPSPESVLEQKLATKKPCNDSGCGDGGAGGDSPGPATAFPVSTKHNSVTSTTSRQLSNLQSKHQTHAQPNLQLSRPMSARLSMDASSMAPVETDIRSTMSTPLNTGYQQSSFDQYSAQQAHSYNESPVPMDNSTHWQSSSSWGGMQQPQMSMHSQYSHEPVHVSQMPAMYADPNLSSCHTAAHILQNINAGVEHDDIAQSLGCVDGQECTVDNSIIFDLMDRYSG